ncbi:S8 family peptidase [Marisediminicola senii]|uniref:S8 family peptidase n=1 Tax=Marisediminicola senii TaxID=2711233 RepID=UPI002E28054B|nr:S8 family serine peptidase [Marisediminicola senii]
MSRYRATTARVTPRAARATAPRTAVRVTVAMLAAAASILLIAQPAAADEVRDRQYWLSSYGVTQAWSTTRGSGVTVAVIDTGVDGTHQDLAGTVVGGTDVSGVGSPDGQTPVGNDSNHGTMVASLLAGSGHGPGNGDGVIGVAPDVDILSVSVGFGVGTITSDEQIAQAVRWSVDNGADVINMSLTRNTLDWPTSWDDAFLYAMQNDVVVVAAAGNRGSGTTSVGAPATMPGVLTVAGVDESGQASFDASAQGTTISVSAPSESLVGAAPGNRYFEWEGTSGAAPLVSGLVALVRSAHPELDANNVINRVIQTATPVNADVPSPIYGYGLMNAAAAVSADVDAVEANPMGDLTEWIRVYRRAEATPEPTPEPTPDASEAPPVVLPDIDPERENPFVALLPRTDTLRDTGVPLLVFAAFLAALAFTARLAIRQYLRLAGAGAAPTGSEVPDPGGAWHVGSRPGAMDAAATGTPQRAASTPDDAQPGATASPRTAPVPRLPGYLPDRARSTRTAEYASDGDDDVTKSHSYYIGGSDDDASGGSGTGSGTGAGAGNGSGTDGGNAEPRAKREGQNPPDWLRF